MQVELEISKSVNANAAVYFERAKKAKRKLAGARKALEGFYAKKASADSVKEKAPVKKELKKIAKKKWYQSFRWFFSSEGFLVVGGRDASTNEVVVKKHTEQGDLVFHTDISGSPFTVIKSERKEIGQATKEEAAIFCASYSRAWKEGLGSAEVFSVKPEQLTKEARPGEFVPKGAFMVYGKKTIAKAVLGLAVGIKDGDVMAGPLAAVKANCSKFVEIRPGNAKPSDVAKEIQKSIGGEIDEIIACLPGGNSDIILKK